MNNLFERSFKVFFPLLIVFVGTYYFYPFELSRIEHRAYLTSYITTIKLTILGLALGMAVGFLVAFLSFLRIKLLTMFINEYLDFMRGLPLTILLFIFAFVVFVHMDDSFYIAVLALGLNASAYIAEIVRGGIESVDRGQMEASRSVGLNYGQTMRHIIFPQAIKNVTPALANEFISLFKGTSIVAFISVVDLTFQSKIFQAVLYDPKPFIFAGIAYYGSVKVFTFFVRMLEQRMKRND